ncbi:hypothetical protein EDB80DRAFT_726015 [Ilyonectria destructans]|nr:hypothetical protein EDB80DRAFT_726015 [Ilyonectria destructans]
MVACQYSVRKTRGPGRTKEYIRMLENRLQRLESSIQPADEPCEPSGSHVDSPNKPDVPEEGSTASLPEIEIPAPTPQTSSLELAVEQTGSTAQSAMPLPLLAFMSKTTRLLELMKELIDNVNPEGFKKTMFTQLFSDTDVFPLLGLVIEDINQVYPLLTQTTLLELLHQQHASGLEDSTESPGRWAVMNSYFAMIMQWKAANNGFRDFSSLAWAFFKNSFSVFPELIIRGNNVLACQGLLFMTMFLQGSADMRTASQILSAAARLSHIIGLNRKAFHSTVQPSEKDAYLQTFWNIYILDANEAMKSGLSPSIDHNDVRLPLPSARLPEELGAVYLSETREQINATRYRAELAIIQSKIQSKLFSETALQWDVTKLSSAVRELTGDLQAWRTSLPLEFRPSVDMTPSTQLELPIILLHFAYYNCIGKIGSIARHLQNSNAPRCSPASAVDLLGTRSNLTSPPSICAAAARATIRLLRSMESQPFTCIWRIICYPLAASITLLADVLSDPMGRNAHLDFELISEFAQLLERLQVAEVCDVNELLAGCSKFRDITQTFVFPKDNIPPFEEVAHPESNRAVSMEQVESMREKLSLHHDHMLLAQGLIGNMPLLCAEASHVFSDILDIPQGSNSEFGLFVPRLLQPQIYNFHFS